ncbi:hypothetical protein ADEAN_000071400 [Angomonas deanei]|uniref:Uncharacterized protein n=1 Tax=Angomonas deanei TaxID=59799 RepID=A0A7G2C3F9_9TRYP|nr:hypothetical protein ADEAN_000071400 [Angomonas deanei]
MSKANLDIFNEQQKLAQLRQQLAEQLADWKTVEETVLHVWSPVYTMPEGKETRAPSVDIQREPGEAMFRTSLIRKRAASNTMRKSLELALQPEQLERSGVGEVTLSPRVQPVISPPQRKLSTPTGSRGSTGAFHRLSNSSSHREESESAMLPAVKVNSVSPSSTPHAPSLPTPRGEGKRPAPLEVKDTSSSDSSSSEEIQRIIDEGTDSEDEPLLAATADATLTSSLKHYNAEKELASTVKVLTLRGRRQSLGTSGSLSIGMQKPPTPSHTNGRRNSSTSKPPIAPTRETSQPVVSAYQEQCLTNETNTPKKQNAFMLSETETVTPHQRETTVVYDRSSERPNHRLEMHSGGKPPLSDSPMQQPSLSSSVSSAERYL